MADPSHINDRSAVSADPKIEIVVEFDQRTWNAILLRSASTPYSPGQYLERLLRHRMMLRHSLPPGPDLEP